MRILTVEDDPLSRLVLHQALANLGHEPVQADDGEQALECLAGSPVRLVVSDWTMPRMDGLELCRRVRARLDTDYVYFILLTGRTGDHANRLEAAEAGVDDFLTKPLDFTELWMRLRVAERILRYATQVRQLEAFLPICSYCKKIRDDQNYWRQIESYINERTGTDFSHSVCPGCYTSIVVPEIEKLKSDNIHPRVRRTH